LRPARGSCWMNMIRPLLMIADRPAQIARRAVVAHNSDMGERRYRDTAERLPAESDILSKLQQAVGCDYWRGARR
jgi:hypothetical protein